MTARPAQPLARSSRYGSAHRSAARHRRFVVVVRRRLALARALEISGSTLAGLAIVASVVTLMGRPSLIPPLLAIACVVAVSWIFRARPTIATAARLSDQHGGWEDLLATAIATCADADPFAVAVRATADARCEATRPSAVPVARRGHRGWMAIATTVCLSLLVLLWPAHRGTTGPDDADPAAAAPLVADADPSPGVPEPPAPSPPVPRRTGVDEMASRGSTPSPDNPSPPAGDGPAHHVDHRSASAGAGRGSSSSAHDPAADRALPSSTGHDADTGTAIAGGGRSARAAAPTTDAPVGSTATASPRPSIPPWQSPGWSDARRDAELAVSAGTIRPQDRDLVRAYFDRAAEPH